MPRREATEDIRVVIHADDVSNVRAVNKTRSAYYIVIGGVVAVGICGLAKTTSIHGQKGLVGVNSAN